MMQVLTTLVVVVGPDRFPRCQHVSATTQSAQRGPWRWEAIEIVYMHIHVATVDDDDVGVISPFSETLLVATATALRL